MEDGRKIWKKNMSPPLMLPSNMYFSNLLRDIFIQRTINAAIFLFHARRSINNEELIEVDRNELNIQNNVSFLEFFFVLSIGQKYQ